MPDDRDFDFMRLRLSGKFLVRVFPVPSPVSSVTPVVMPFTSGSQPPAKRRASHPAREHFPPKPETHPEFPGGENRQSSHPVCHCPLLFAAKNKGFQFGAAAELTPDPAQRSQCAHQLPSRSQPPLSKATRACRKISDGMKSLSSGIIPPVSTTRKSRPRHSATPVETIASNARLVAHNRPPRPCQPVEKSVDFPHIGAANNGDQKGAQRFAQWISALCVSKYYRDSVASRSQTVSPAAGSSLYQFFAPGGLLSKTHPAYEFRRGQLQMAQSVEEAISEKRHLVVEAGTGTGKTLAYLLPVIRSGKRVIIRPAPRISRNSSSTRTYLSSNARFSGTPTPN